MKKAPYVKVKPDGRVFVRFEEMPMEQQLAEIYLADVVLAGIEQVKWGN